MIISKTKHNTSAENKTAKYFYILNRWIYICGMPILIFEDTTLPEIPKKLHKLLSRFATGIFFIFIVLQWGSLFTQHNLTEKQVSDRRLFLFSHPILFLFVTSVFMHKNKTRKVLKLLTKDLKIKHNDGETEKHMIKRAKFYSMSFCFAIFSTMFSYGVDSFFSESTFTTAITLWPNTNDESTKAAVWRVVIYIVWCVFVFRGASVYVLMISISICLYHQYKHLQRYFISLSDIFDDETLNQIEKEHKYVKSFVDGIHAHYKTNWCTEQCKDICNVVFSGQIMINIFGVLLQFIQLVESDRSPAHVFAIASMAITLVFTTGFLMCNAGNISEEASQLGTAMYCSGWHKCRISTVQVRQLLVISMQEAQRPVVLQSFGIVTLSYESYIKIVKTSYSIFSVVY